MIEYDLPHTEQGLRDFIRYAEGEIKRSAMKTEKLNKMIAECNKQLTSITSQKGVEDGSEKGGGQVAQESL